MLSFKYRLLETIKKSILLRVKMDALNSAVILSILRNFDEVIRVVCDRRKTKIWENSGVCCSEGRKGWKSLKMSFGQVRILEHVINKEEIKNE